MSGEGEGEVHEYLSTACTHGLMEEMASGQSVDSVAYHHLCRRECKWCDAPCACLCHDGGMGVVL